MATLSPSLTVNLRRAECLWDVCTVYLVKGNLCKGGKAVAYGNRAFLSGLNAGAPSTEFW